MMPLLLPIDFLGCPTQLTPSCHFLLYSRLDFFSNAPYRMAILEPFFCSSQQIQSKSVAQCVEYYYSWKKEHKLAKTLAQVRKSRHARRRAERLGRRGQKLLASRARRRSARSTWSRQLGKAQQMLPGLLPCAAAAALHFWNTALSQPSSTVTKVGLDALETGCSRAGALADSYHHILNSPLLANLTHPGCLHADAADVQASFGACQHPPQSGAATAVAPLKLSLPANLNLLHT